jgi:hypothetical protein
MRNLLLFIIFPFALIIISCSTSTKAYLGKEKIQFPPNIDTLIICRAFGGSKNINSRISTVFEKNAKNSFSTIGEMQVIEALQKENIYQLPEEYTYFLMKKVMNNKGGKYYVVPKIVINDTYSNIELQYFFYDIQKEQEICRIKVVLLNNSIYNQGSISESNLSNFVIENASKKVIKELNKYLNSK